MTTAPSWTVREPHGGLSGQAFDRRETLAASIARMDRAEAEYFQVRAADNATLAAHALATDAPVETTARLQRAAAFFAAEARRVLFRLVEDGGRDFRLDRSVTNNGAFKPLFSGEGRSG